MQVSWIDEEPYITCPDHFTVLDRETGDGFSNFRTKSWTQGRKVAIRRMNVANRGGLRGD